jgi:uncharacterized protein with LGFP repeats
MVTSPAAYGKAVKVVFVHHTDTGNDYSCADSPAVVRSIFLYHVQTNGWNDIGYNFLVDKCGTLFEGRSGGVDAPVIGAHAYGFNTDSAGVAVLGTFTDVAPPQPALDTVARVAAWKLGLDGGSPTGPKRPLSRPRRRWRQGPTDCCCAPSISTARRRTRRCSR